QLCNECIAKEVGETAHRAAESSLESSRGGRKITGTTHTRDIAIAGGIHLDSTRLLRVRASKVCGKHECRTGAVKLRDEGIAERKTAASESGLKSSGSCWEISRGLCESRYVRIA